MKKYLLVKTGNVSASFIREFVSFGEAVSEMKHQYERDRWALDKDCISRFRNKSCLVFNPRSQSLSKCKIIRVA